MRFSIVLLALVLLTSVGFLVLFLIESIPDIRLRVFKRKLKKLSAVALVDLALQSDRNQEYTNAIMVQISNSDDLLRIVQEAKSASVKAAAQKRYCLLFGHRTNGTCVCGSCLKIIHDFRDAQGRSPANTPEVGEYACTRCQAIFCREEYPSCDKTCPSKSCDEDFCFERYSSQSGQGGSWFEKCPDYHPSGIQETIRYK